MSFVFLISTRYWVIWRIQEISQEFLSSLLACLDGVNVFDILCGNGTDAFAIFAHVCGEHWTQS